jgi:hypothetical protein
MVVVIVMATLSGCVHRAPETPPVAMLVIPSNQPPATPFLAAATLAMWNATQDLLHNITPEDYRDVNGGEVSFHHQSLAQAKSLIENNSYPDAYWHADNALWRSLMLETGAEAADAATKAGRPEREREMTDENNTTLPAGWADLALKINVTRSAVQAPLWGPLLQVEVDYVRGLATLWYFQHLPGNQNAASAALSWAALHRVQLELDYVRSLPAPEHGGINETRVHEWIGRAFDASNRTPYEPTTGRDELSLYGRAKVWWPMAINDSLARGWPEAALEYALETIVFENATELQIVGKLPSNAELNRTIEVARAAVTDPVDEWFYDRGLSAFGVYNRLYPDKEAETTAWVIGGYAIMQHVPWVHETRLSAGASAT